MIAGVAMWQSVCQQIISERIVTPATGYPPRVTPHHIKTIIKSFYEIKAHLGEIGGHHTYLFIDICL